MATPSAGAATISYLALGDSYTIGEGAPAAGRWPVQLAAQAQAQGLPLAEPTIIARTGWTTAELQDAIRAADNHHTYGLVSLLIGVNNQYRGQSVALYRTEFRALLATAIAFAGGQARHVVVLSIPDWGQTPFAEGRDRAQIAAEIDQFNQAAHQECQHADVAFVDITPATRAAAADEKQFTADGLHYTSAQMRGWAAQALPVVQRQLR
ncbi:MAG: SGNH/GDSL hydrolase family protein [Janthinobacterium lividum]